MARMGKLIGTKPVPVEKELEQLGYGYLIHSSNNRSKIGITKSITTRLSTVQTGNPEKLDGVHFSPSNHTDQSKKFLHDTDNHKKIKNEWFNPSHTDIQAIWYISSELDMQS